MKATRIFYWVFTIFFGLLMFMDGIGGVTQQEAGQEVMRHLGYPMYVLIIFGVAKLLGAVAIVQNKFQTIKEWAYAGFAFNFIGAFASRWFVGDRGGEMIFPLIALAIMFIPYVLWKKYQKIKTT
jgi:uncharacterized membrane protein YphA (DoxX/SURF4 family)